MDINQFFVAGINYRKTDTIIRGDYAVSADQYTSLLQKAADAGIAELFVLSTCNRTEIYGVADNVIVMMLRVVPDGGAEHCEPTVLLQSCAGRTQASAHNRSECERV